MGGNGRQWRQWAAMGGRGDRCLPMPPIAALVSISHVSSPMMSPKDRNKRERRWQTSQERARVAAALIDEAESLTGTAAIAPPRDGARDDQPPPIRVPQPLAPPAVTSKLDDAESSPPPAPPEPPPPPAQIGRASRRGR